MNPYFSLSEKVYDITERYPELIFWPPTDLEKSAIH